jgi:hypothetical protein
MGGGVILVSVIIILVQQQRKPAKPAPVVHHPINIPLSYGQVPYGNLPRRSSLMLPPQVRRPSPGMRDVTPPQPPSIPTNPYNVYPPLDNNIPNLYRDWEG